MIKNSIDDINFYIDIYQEKQIISNKNSKIDVVEISELFLLATLIISKDEVKLLNLKKRNDLLKFIKEIRKCYALLCINLPEIYINKISEEIPEEEITEEIKNKLNSLKMALQNIEPLLKDIKEFYRKALDDRITIELAILNKNSTGTKETTNQEKNNAMGIRKLSINM